MFNSIVSIVFISTIFLLSVKGQSYDEKYRLQVHYSVKAGWANDPNRLIYAGGYYHLFYQFSPYDTIFGLVHWGHARSKDLVHWENMPIALKPYDNGKIYSGCCVFDEKNVTGFALKYGENVEQSKKPLIAIYTHKEIGGAETESQALAYSFDDGITWTQYADNPIIKNPGIYDFRDPMIFQRNGRFYMALVVCDRVRFLSSTDLITWNVESDFGVNPDEGDKTGIWECPWLITLKEGT